VRFSFQGALFPYRTAPLLEILADGRHADPEWPSLVITWAYCACLPDPGFWFRVPLDVRARVAYRLGTGVGRDPGALRPSTFLQRISRPIGR
jgi:hypothetical protein